MITKDELISLKESIKENLEKRVIELTYLDRGACNNLYYFKTDDGNEYSIKQERRDKLDNEKNNPILEAKILRLLKKKNIPFIPEIIFFNKKTKLICYKYISGIPLESIWTTLTKKKKENIMSELGKLHALIHLTASIQESVKTGISLDNNSVEFVLAKFKKNIKQTHKKTSALYKIISKVDNYYIQNKPTQIFNGLLHGDLHHGNIIINKGKLSGVVDFGKSKFGDIHRDFSHYARHYPNYLDAIIKSYEKYSIYKLNKNIILLWGLLTDIEKVIYHAIKLTSGEQGLLKKMNSYEKLLNNT